MNERTVVFDLGGVLASDEGKVEALAGVWGVDADALRAPYWAGRLEYDRGCSNLNYFSTVAQAIGVEMDEDLANRLAAADAKHWAQLRPSALAILDDLQAAGVPTALLSNAPVAMATAIEQAPWRTYFGDVVVSGLVETIKPEPEIYAEVERVLALTGERLAFIDDKQYNVDGAIAAGWQAVLWRDDATTRQFLVDGGWLS